MAKTESTEIQKMLRKRGESQLETLRIPERVCEVCHLHTIDHNLDRSNRWDV